MAHFAQLDSNNIVTQVIVVDNDDCLDENGNESESVGVDFCKRLLGENTIWKQTSYNNNFRNKYAWIGDIYNEEHDAFISPKKFNSWILDTETLNWKAPIDKPELIEGQLDYLWNEKNYNSGIEPFWVSLTEENINDPEIQILIRENF